MEGNTQKNSNADVTIELINIKPYLTPTDTGSVLARIEVYLLRSHEVEICRVTTIAINHIATYIVAGVTAVFVKNAISSGKPNMPSISEI